MFSNHTKFFFFALLGLVTGVQCTEPSSPLATELRAEYLENPLGIAPTPPRLSWKMQTPGRNKSQSAYQIIVSSSPENLEKEQGDLWDSQKVFSTANKQIRYGGPALASRSFYYWKVRIWDEKDQRSAWSSPAYWSTGIKPEDWQAQWIACDTPDGNPSDTLLMPGVALFRKPFQVDAPIQRATVYASALGLFELSLNGEKLGQDLLAPGWTDYDQRVYYQTYDATALIRQGENVIGSRLAEGWYSGHVGPRELRREKSREMYGKQPGLLVQLEIEFADGSRRIIGTDQSWQARPGPTIQADILMGEIYNAALEVPEWDQPGNPTGQWGKPNLHDGTSGILEPYPGHGIQVYAELPVQRISEPESGVFLFDFGQNFAGVVRLKVQGEKGDSLILRHGEMLHQDGSLMTENLRFAKATDVYILKGKETEIWQPSFTYHGFRYVEVRGLRDQPDKELLTGIAFSSKAPYNGEFQTSDTLVNRLYENILWTQRSNFMDVPTDSPQRDERLGWLGDAQIFSKSALFNAQLGNFFRKWLTDVSDAQFEDGLYPVFAPNPYRDLKWIAPGWMEAGIIVPYYTYRFYNDTALVRQQYASMTRFMDYHLKKVGDRYFYPEDSWTEANPRGGFGDWLELTDQHSAHDILSSFYFAYALDMMAEMSAAIGETKAAAVYQQALDKLKVNLADHYLDAAGKFRVDEAKYGDRKGYFEGEKGFTGHTQSIYASAFYFDILSGSHRENAAKHLATLIAAAGNKPTSGILGIRQLLPGLVKAGHGDLAYKILRNTEYPGWGFEITQGATTIWERWNSYTLEHGFNGAMNAKMNSFNHYAFGAVGEFLFNHVVGIQAGSPGFDTIVIQPEIGDRSIAKVHGAYDSINGKISTSWEIQQDKFLLKVQIPPNTHARVHLPVKEGTTVTENGQAIGEEIHFLKRENGRNIYEIGSGTYEFQSTLPAR